MAKALSGESMTLRNRNQLSRILDVASGIYLHDINMSKCRWIGAIKANSNYVVIIADSNLYVYSLQALRNPLPGDALVFKIKYCHDLYSLTVDETQIVFQDGIQGLTQFFDFGSFDEKPMSTLAAPWNKMSLCREPNRNFHVWTSLNVNNISVNLLSRY